MLPDECVNLWPCIRTRTVAIKQWITPEVLNLFQLVYNVNNEDAFSTWERLFIIYTLSKSPIHLSFIRIYHFDTLSLAVWQDTCHTYKNLVYDLAPHESPIAQWLERPTGIWKVMGSTPVGCSENSFSEYCDLRTLLHYLHFIQVTNPFIIY